MPCVNCIDVWEVSCFAIVKIYFEILIEEHGGRLGEMSNFVDIEAIFNEIFKY